MVQWSTANREFGVQILVRQKFGSRFLLHLRSLANSATMSTLTVHCQWEDDTVMERTGHPPFYAEAKKNEVANTSYPWMPRG